MTAQRSGLVQQHEDEPEATEADRRTPRIRTAERFGIVAVGLLCVVVGWVNRWTADDAFISFRAIENFLAGHGMVFNAGERVEVTTSPLWAYMLAAMDAVVPGSAVAWLSVLGGIALSAAGVVLGCLGCIRLRQGAVPRATMVPFGALVFLALPPVWDFITSGLESGLAFGWLGLCWWGLAGLATADPARRRPVWLLVALGLGPLIRPDLAVVTVALALYVTLSARQPLLRRAADLATAAALPVAYEIFRMGYYGLLVPNTAIAKESTRALWARGWTYLADFVAPYYLLVPAVAVAAATGLAIWELRDRRRVVALIGTFLVAAALHVLFVVRVGGDFMHARLLLPGAMMALLPMFLVPVTRERARVSLGLVGVVAVWAALCMGSMRVDYLSGIGASGIADERGVYEAAASASNPVTLYDHRGNGSLEAGRQINAAADRDADLLFSQGTVSPSDPTSLAAVGDGADRTYFALFQAGYLGDAVGADVWVVDYYGLTDPVGAHLEAQAPGRPGHEKVMPVSWVWAHYGEGSPAIPAPHPIVGRVEPADVGPIQRVLECGEVAELLSATNDPMSADRFWDNLTGAVERTALRIPADPRVAETTFC